MAAGIRARLSAADGRRFGLTVGAAFLGLAVLGWWRASPPVVVVCGGIGGVLVLAGLVAPGRLGPVFAAWMGLARVLSRITTPIVLGLVYFGVITPIGLLMGLLRRRPLTRPPGAASWWISRDANARQRADMQRQF